MKKNRLFFAVISFFMLINLFANNSKALTLEVVCESLASRPNTIGSFTQTKSLKANGRKLKSSGSFIISAYGILWSTEKPFPSSLILTQDTMIQLSGNGKKSVMNSRDNQIFSNISNTLSSVFSGKVSELKKNFTCEFSEEPAGNWRIFLTPKDSTIASVMKKLVLSGQYDLETGAAELESLEMAEASGNSILYEFSNQKYPEELSQDEKQNFIID